MSAVKVSSFRAKKNCLLVFRNKKINVFNEAEKLISAFSGFGYYFDKIAYVAYDRGEEIVNALNDGRINYENLFIFCPVTMDTTLKTFLAAIYATEPNTVAKFDEKGILSSGGDHVFVFYCDRENVLKCDEVKLILDQKYGRKYEKEYLKVYGVSYNDLNSVIYNAKQICGEIDFNISESYGDYQIEITYPNSISKEIFDSVIRIFVTRLKDNIYAMENLSLAERLFQLLKLRRAKISVAESFTGGGIAQKLVSLAGISEVYLEGLNTYSGQSKMNRLGVKELTLHRYGAVSRQTAQEMVDGLIKSSGCDVGIATTGVAGPTTDSELNPVGRIFIAVGVGEDCSVFEYNLNGTREDITNTAINLALFNTYKLLKNSGV